MSFEYAYTTQDVNLWGDPSGMDLPKPNHHQGEWELVRVEFVKYAETASHIVNKTPDYNASKTDSSTVSHSYRMVAFWRRWFEPATPTHKQGQTEEALKSSATF